MQSVAQLILNQLAYMSQQQPLEEIDAAIDCLKSAFKIADVQPDDYLERLVKCSDQLVSKTPEEYKAEANELMKQEQYEKAIEKYTMALANLDNNNKNNRANSIIYANRGLAKKNLNKIQEAIEDYEMALKYDPTYEKAQQRLEQAKQLLNEKKDQKSGFDVSSLPSYMQELAKDPEVAELLKDPQFQEKLNQIKQNPMQALQLLNDPKLQGVMSKIMSKFGGQFGNIANMFQ